MLKLRLKNTSQAIMFQTLSFSLKGNMISVYDNYNPVTKFVTKNVFDIVITEKNEGKEKKEKKELKKINVSIKLNNSATPICLENVVQTDNNEHFYVIYIETESEKITRFFPLDDIFSVKEDY